MPHVSKMAISQKKTLEMAGWRVKLLVFSYFSYFSFPGSARTSRTLCASAAPRSRRWIKKFTAQLSVSHKKRHFRFQIFDFCYDYKLRHMKAGRETPICDRIVFNKIRKLLGGRMRYEDGMDGTRFPTSETRIIIFSKYSFVVTKKGVFFHGIEY